MITRTDGFRSNRSRMNRNARQAAPGGGGLARLWGAVLMVAVLTAPVGLRAQDAESASTDTGPASAAPAVIEVAADAAPGREAGGTSTTMRATIRQVDGQQEQRRQVTILIEGDAKMVPGDSQIICEK